MNLDLNMNLGLAQEQKLIMTQQMQISIKMLQMSAFELNEYINQQVEKNPIIDVEENRKDEGINDRSIDYKKFIEYLDRDNYSNTTNRQSQSEYVSPFTFISREKSLKDYLFEQIRELKENEYTKALCEYIIENLDKKGYLDNTIQSMSKEVSAKEQEVIHALSIVQSLEPDGIAARDLKECLKIQLCKKNIKDDNLTYIIDNFLELLGDNKLNDISKKMNIKKNEVQKYFDIIRKLEPKPSRGFYTGENVGYIVPDAYIREIGEKIYIVMNDNLFPNIKVNKVYKSMITSNENNKESEYVKNKINNAMFLIKSIQHRKSTIRKVLEEILIIQEEYFKLGKEYLKPMTLREIAERIEVHESTVSRAIRDKYIHTKRGTMKIKDLFTNGIASMALGEEISVVSIKNRIKEYINEEDKKKPLSDQKICDLLKREGMNISRRTVAKYREEMGIKSSSKRKRF